MCPIYNLEELKMADNYNQLCRRLEDKELYERFAYKDTKGNLTIGIGRNLTAKGISREEALFLLHNDINKAEEQISIYWPPYKSLDAVRKLVLIELTFNMGVGSIMGFKKFLKYLEESKNEMAADELLDSQYYHDVGKRAKELAEIVKTGIYEW